MHIGLVIAKLVVVMLGLSIAFQSYRGYRRNDRPELLYVACGFALVSIGAILEGVLYDILNWPLFTAGMVQSIVVALGLVTILYSLFAQFDAHPGSR